MIRFLIVTLFAASTVSLFSACVSLPNIYLVDRHTVMESEASGEWPILEKRFIDSSLSAGPVAFAKEGNEANSSKKELPANILLNAELNSGLNAKVSTGSQL